MNRVRQSLTRFTSLRGRSSKLERSLSVVPNLPERFDAPATMTQTQFGNAIDYGQHRSRSHRIVNAFYDEQAKRLEEIEAIGERHMATVLFSPNISVQVIYALPPCSGTLGPAML
jgi:hypothetical protein